MKKINSLIIALASIACFGAAHAGDAPYPADHVIRLVVPFPAGGPTDIVARPLAKEMSVLLGQSVIVDNRGGAGGTIGAEIVAKSKADGYTLFLGTVGTQAINESIYKRLPFDPHTSFTPVALVGFAPLAIVAHKGLGIQDVASLLSKSKSNSITFGSAGNGSPGHLAGERFKAQTGAKLTHVPYKGSGPAVQDLIGGQITLMFDPVQSVLSQIKGGNLVPLAVTSTKRLDVLPNVPTVAESGVAGYEMTAWWGLLAPANLPKPILQKLSAAVQQATKSPAMTQLRALGIELSYMDSDNFGKFIATESTKWGQVVRDSGATLD
jgi:tripartite-type tricarboxylate transporter receptor subunit TctC